MNENRIRTIKQIKIMITLKRYLLTLVALLAMTTGAWADEGTLLTTINASSDFTNGSKTFDNVVTVTFSGSVNYGGGWFYTVTSTPVTVTVSAANDDVIITSVKFFTTLGDVEDKESTYEAQLKAKNGFDPSIGAIQYYQVYVNGSIIGAENAENYLTKIEVYGTKKESAPEVTISTDQQSAEFDMPSYDATLEYQIVRNLASNMTVSIGDGQDGYRIRVKKQGESFVPAEMTLQQMMALYTVHDATEQKDLLFYGDGKVCDISIYAVDDQGQPTGQAIAFTALTPGRYVAIATAPDDSPLYAGQTPQSNIFVLYQGYDLTLTSAQASSVAVTIGDAAVTPEQGGRIPGVELGKSVKLSVSEGYMFSDMFTGYKVSFTPAGNALAWTKVGCYYWGDYGNNNIFNPVTWPGVQMQKNGNSWETTINVNGLTNIIFNDFKENNAQQTSDLPFASGAADNLGSYTIADAVEMTYNNAKTEATFSMPASNVGMSFNVKRNLGVKTAAEMAERIRINKTGDTYSPIQMTDVQPTVTNNLDAQNPVVLEFGKDYSTTLQKKGEGQDEWIDTQDYGVGTYRLMVTGNGEYGGTCYTNEFELYAGYEVTVAAGEYATFYGKEAVVVEGEDAELYTIANVTESEAQLSDAIKVAPKETPLLVYNKGTEEKTFLLIPTAEPDLLLTVAPEFKGTAVAQSMTASSTTVSYYVCTGKAFEYVNEDGEIAANKCWLQIGEQPATSRRNTRSIVGGGNATGIESIHNSQFTIDSYYDLQGRKVATPNRKGIYIHNGKKVVVRK